MTDEGVGMLVLGGVSVLCALVAHWRLRSFALAVALSSLAAALLFQLAVALHLDYLDAFALVASFLSLLPAAIIAVLVGLPFLARRQGKSQGGP